MQVPQQQYRRNIFSSVSPPIFERPLDFFIPERICSHCKKVKQEQHRCNVGCQYCHNLHQPKDLIENLCPVMYPIAKKMQEKGSYVCKVCKGEGSFTQQTETIRYESSKKYEARLKEWYFQRRFQTQMLESKPERKILFRQKKTHHQSTCNECQGKGKIIRLINCCSFGCAACNGDKFRINPVWQKYRIQPVKNQSLFNCPICLAEVGKGSQKFTLECKHEFHYQCIFKWMKNKKNCPVCRQKDIYLQGVELPQNNMQENSRDILFFHQNPLSQGSDDSWMID